MIKVAGEYIATDKFSQGRIGYQNKTSKIYLHVWPGYTAWNVSREVGGCTVYIHSPAAGSLCPADQRNTYSHRRGWNSWRYYSGSKWLEANDNIVVKCSKHGLDCE